MINFNEEGLIEVDEVVDASLSGLWMFGMYSVDDPKIIATMNSIKDRLWVKTDVGGIARYENDYYHQVSQDIENVPGNPCFICTLWLAEWYAQTAKNAKELSQANELLRWASERTLQSGVLAEQVDPFTNDPVSVSPLTWSHATFITTALAYLDATKKLQKVV